MNLIYIFADQWRRDAIGFYDNTIQTPHIDTLAEQGIIFDRAYSSCPLCSPARASLLTGKQPSHTGVFTNCKPSVSAHLSCDDICISDVLKQNGYATGYIGKWHLDQPDSKDANGSWDAFTPPGKRRHGFDFWYSYGACDQHTTPHYWDTQGNRIQVSQWSVTHETDVALSFLEERKDKDFALFISYNPPHTPYELTPKSYAQMYKGVHRPIMASSAAPEGRGDRMPENEDWDAFAVANYYGAVTSIDENVARIIEYLKGNGLYDSTYIVLSADHGDMLGDHQLYAKHIWYEGAVGIPLIIAGGDVCSGRSDALVSTPDQTATLVGLLAIQAPGSMTGIDFSPLIKHKVQVHQESVMTAAFPNTAEGIEEYTAHGKNFMDYGWRSVVTKDYKLAVDKGHTYGYTPKIYLYDLKNDPFENISLEDPAVMERMMAHLKDWLEKNEDHFLDDISLDLFG